VRLFSGALVYGNRLPFRIPHCMKIDLGGGSISMPKDSLNSSDGNTVMIHVRCPCMPHRMKGKAPDTRLFEQSFEDGLTVLLKWRHNLRYPILVASKNTENGFLSDFESL
jgi:hypothetical protein